MGGGGNKNNIIIRHKLQKIYLYKSIPTLKKYIRIYTFNYSSILVYNLLSVRISTYYIFILKSKYLAQVKFE